MTSTSQTDPSDNATDSASVNEAQSETGTRSVPLEALAASRQKARTAEQELAEVKAELARLKESAGAAPAQTPTEIQELSKQLAVIQRREQMRDLSRDLGLPDVKQAEAVATVMAKNSDLTPAEAMELARKRQPDLFNDLGQPAFDPGMHGSLRPTSGGHLPVESDRTQRLEAITKAQGFRKEALVNNYLGGVAARLLGLPHNKIPLQ
jgi:hypothetical protein